MFDSYIKSIYHVINKNNTNQNELKCMLKLNNKIINYLKHQSGGAGSPSTNDKINDLITNITLDINKLKANKSKDFDGVLRYVNFIHSKIPDDRSIATLKSQLVEINGIINKYTDSPQP